MNKKPVSPRRRAFVRPAAAVLARSYLGIAFSFTLWALAPLLFQWTPTIVMSGSMSPSLMTGDVVVARPVSPAQATDGTVKQGHVLLAEDPLRPGTLFTHRVVDIGPDGFITRGDANAAPDPLRLPASAVKGIEVIRVPHAGYPFQQAREGNILPAAALVLITVAAQMVVLADNRAHKAAGSHGRPARGRRRAQPRPGTRREARLMRERSRKAPARAAAAFTSAVAVTAAMAFGASSAAFTGWTGNPGDIYRAAASFPVPGISAKPLRFGVGEPNGSLAALDLVSREVGEYPSYSQIYRDFRGTFDMPVIQSTLARGVTPIVTWEPFDASVGGTNQPAYALKTITAGTHDAYLGSVADQLTAAGNPRIYLRFAHEMNGDWYPWGVNVNGNEPGDYVAAWRHVVDLFAARGVSNVTWVWAPNAIYGGAAEVSGLYPGSAYVGLTGVDGFNWGTTQTWSSWQRPWDVFGSSFDALQAVAPDKNILISEVASAETEGANTKAEWILDAVYYFNHWGDGKPLRIEGFVWFDFEKETHWRIDSSTASYEAMRKALADR